MLKCRFYTKANTRNVGFFSLSVDALFSFTLKLTHTQGTHSHAAVRYVRSIAKLLLAGREARVEGRKQVLNHISSCLSSVVSIQERQFLAAASGVISDPAAFILFFNKLSYFVHPLTSPSNFTVMFIK